MGPMSKCLDCGKPHRASGRRCLACKTKARRLFKNAKTRGWIVDMAGGGWWVWDAHGNVLGQGDTGMQALKQALAVMEPF